MNELERAIDFYEGLVGLDRSRGFSDSAARYRALALQGLRLLREQEREEELWGEG